MAIEKIKDIVMRGDDQEWFIRLLDPDGEPLPLRSLVIRITAKPPGSDAADDSDAIYTHTATFGPDGEFLGGLGIRLGGTDPTPDSDHPIFTDPDDGVITEFLTDEDIAKLSTIYDALSTNQKSRPVVEWDIQVTDAIGRRKTVGMGSIALTRDIGRLV